MPRDTEQLTAALRAMRARPSAEFAASLDARVAAGFSRGEGRAAPIAQLARRLSAARPRRALAAAAACALAAIAIATGAIVISNGGSPKYRAQIATSTAPAPVHRLHNKTQFSEAPRAGRSTSRAESAAGSASVPAAPNGAEVQTGESVPGATTGPYASHTRHRNVERTAAIVLAASPSEVRDDAARVFEAVHAANGIVMRSSIQDGGAGEAGASFDLLIPSGQLGDALAALSAIGDVRSRHESSEDITAPTVGVGERLRDARATISSLLAQLAVTTSEAERASIEFRLHRERGRAAALRSRLSDLHRRASFSRVSVRIETGDEGSSGGGWGFDDALRTAGKILAVAAGVAVVGLAVLVPFSLVLFLAAVAYRFWLRRARDRALA